MNLATEERQESEPVRPGPGPARLGGTDIFRGALVIITAIVIGGFVISRGLDQGDSTGLTSETETEAADPAAPGDGGDEQVAIDDGTAADGLDGSTDDGQPSVSTPGVTTAPDPAVDEAMEEAEEPAVEDTVAAAPTARTPAEVKVLVLNGAQTQGIAAKGTEALKAASYTTAAPKNANTQQPSAILYQEGYELDAIAVAGVFTAGLETLVRPLDPTNVPIDDMQGSNVIVVIGNDDLIPVP